MTENLAAFLIVIISGIVFAFYALRYRGRKLQHREYPIFNSLSEEVGRAAEEGLFIHITLGSGDITGEDALTSVAALEGLTALLNLSAAYDTPPIVTTGNPTLFLLADDWVRRAYIQGGNLMRYRRNLVEFVSSSPATYAAMTSTQLYSNNIGSNVMLGAFNQEVSLITEAAARRGIFSMGGSVTPLAMGALYPALGPRHFAMGEELFASGAEVSPAPSYRAALNAQHLLRWLVMFGILVTSFLSLIGILGR